MFSYRGGNRFEKNFEIFNKLNLYHALLFLEGTTKGRGVGKTPDALLGK